MVNFGRLISTVQENCHISDARFARNYSMCTFLLKMREYFRWENELPFSCDLSRAELGDWLVEREQAWEEFESRRYRHVPLADASVDPFDAEAINRELIPQGYVYSSGYGLFHKPHFLLGGLLKHEQRDGVSVLISSCEYARDLVAPPAMSLNGMIFVRQESVRRFIWERIEESRWSKSENNPVKRAMDAYTGCDDIEELLERMTENEMESLVLHELGEVAAGSVLGPEWEDMIVAIAPSQAEHIVRAVRDNLADCMSTLPALLERENAAALHFYFGNFTGLRRALFPEAFNAYNEWVDSGRLRALQDAVCEGEEQWRGAAHTILNQYRSHGHDTAHIIEETHRASLN